MANLEFKVCPKCKRLMPVGNGSRYCQSCSAGELERKRGRKRDYAAEYAKRSAEEDAGMRRFYRSKEWTMVSRAYAQKMKYRCEDCGGIGTDVHHIDQIQGKSGWARRFDESNLALLCVACHNRRHLREFGGGSHAEQR